MRVYRDIVSLFLFLGNVCWNKVGRTQTYGYNYRLHPNSCLRSQKESVVEGHEVHDVSSFVGFLIHFWWTGGGTMSSGWAFWKCTNCAFSLFQTHATHFCLSVPSGLYAPPYWLTQKTKLSPFHFSYVHLQLFSSLRSSWLYHLNWLGPGKTLPRETKHPHTILQPLTS